MMQNERWLMRYGEVVNFIETNHRNPSRHRIEEHDYLNWLIKKYEKKTSSTIDKVKLLLREIDKELDSYGLEETKNMYESYVTPPKE